MKFHRSLWMMTVAMLVVILSSCNLGAAPAPTQDVGAIQTQAFSLVLTQVVLQSSPTPLPTNTAQATTTLAALPTFAQIGGTTPFAFNTPLAVLGLTPLALPVPTLALNGLLPTKNGCNDGVYTGETPHHTDPNFLVVGIGEYVEQFFTFRNTGTCAWDEGYAFVYQPEVSSPELEGNTIIIAKDKPEDITKPGHDISFKAIIRAPKINGEYKAYWKLRDDLGNEFGSLVSLFIRVRKP